MADRNLFAGMGRLADKQATEHCKTFFPHASRFGPQKILDTISKNLIEGLVKKDAWYRLNAYHLCYLYDSLTGIVDDYSYENDAGKKEIFPELEGAPIDLEGFLQDYFFNTSFLMAQDRFNNLSPEEKNRLGLIDPCLFGVINRLVPTDEEAALEKVNQNPYTR